MSIRINDHILAGNEFYGYTTNRIIEIPQDIKLELNNGTLTLKAGSKVYVPNGFESDGTTPKFDVRVIESDINYLYGSANTATILLCGDAGLEGGLNVAYSGATAPSVSGNLYALWYDTANNLVKVHGDGWDAGGHSLPIGIAHRTINVGYDSIDQIFNGFGYIGSTVFALPGVKVQIPNGRNEDGTCKDTLWTSSRVFISASVNWNGACVWVIGAESRGYPIGPVGASDWNYNSETNYNGFSGYPQWPAVICAYGVVSSTGVISSFTPCNVDSIANSNASNFSREGRSYLSGLGAANPVKYENVTLLASGQSYRVPANGYFSISKKVTAAGQFLGFFNCGANYQWASTSDQYIRITTPLLKKGIAIGLEYNAAGDLQFFNFIYADGEV